MGKIGRNHSNEALREMGKNLDFYSFKALPMMGRSLDGAVQDIVDSLSGNTHFFGEFCFGEAPG